MAEMLSHSFSQFTFNAIITTSIKGAETQKTPLRPIQCVLTEEKRQAVVKNGKDSLDICRVVNGMWQTSGGWGKIERNSAVDAMLRYADAGLSTFDMADICKTKGRIYKFHTLFVESCRPPLIIL